MNTYENTPPSGVMRAGKTGAVFAVIGLIGLLINWVTGHSLRTLLESYLYGWTFAMLFALGCYGFMLLQYMVQGSWARPVIRIFEAGAKSLPVMGLLFIPILLGYQTLYPWADAHRVQMDPILAHRAGYYSIAMFTFRTIVYFAIWSVSTFVLAGMSKRQDETRDIRIAGRRQRWSAVCFLIYIVTTTLAFTDWIMSLDAHWFSTLYGFWFVDFQGLAALSLVTLLVTRLRLDRREPYNTLVTPQVTRDLGNLLLTLVMVWAYFSLSQWLIVWSGNLPEEITFYLKRNAGQFLLVGAFNIVFSFFVPFVTLLSGRTKKEPVLLNLVCVGLLVMRMIDLFWVVIPAERHPIGVVWTDAAALVFAFGTFLYTMTLLLKQAGIIPQHDAPLTQEVLHHA